MPSLTGIGFSLRICSPSAVFFVVAEARNSLGKRDLATGRPKVVVLALRLKPVAFGLTNQHISASGAHQGSSCFPG